MSGNSIFPQPTFDPVDVAIQQEFTRVRGIVRNDLQAAFARSHQSGKPVLVLLGELHDSPRSALLELTIYDIARQFGIHDVAFELDPATGERELREEMLERSHMTGMNALHTYATYLQAPVHYVDGLHARAEAQSDPSQRPTERVIVTDRNADMAQRLIQLNRPLVLVAGTNHQQGLLQDTPLRDHYEVVAYTLMSPQLYENVAAGVRRVFSQFRTGDTPSGQPRLSAHIPAGTQSVDIPTEVLNLSIERMAMHALSNPYQAQAFVGHMRSYLLRGGPQIETADTNSSRFQTALQMYQQDPSMGGLILSFQLYDHHRDEAAGRLAAQAFGNDQARLNFGQRASELYSPNFVRSFEEERQRLLHSPRIELGTRVAYDPDATVTPPHTPSAATVPRSGPVPPR